MKYFWYPLALFCFCVLVIWVGIKNLPRAAFNAFHKRKKRYWHPVDWLMQDEYDIYRE